MSAEASLHSSKGHGSHEHEQHDHVPTYIKLAVVLSVLTGAWKLSDSVCRTT